MIVLKLIAVLAMVTMAHAEVSDWETDREMDPMEETKIIYILSKEVVEPVKKLDDPYGDVVAKLGVGCKSGDHWAYIDFSDLNPAGRTTIIGGYQIFDLRVKWTAGDGDKIIRKHRFKYKGSENHLRLHDPFQWMAYLMKYEKVMVELEWYRLGTAHFEWSIRGFEKAYKACDSLP